MRPSEPISSADHFTHTMLLTILLTTNAPMWVQLTLGSVVILETIGVIVGWWKDWK